MVYLCVYFDAIAAKFMSISLCFCVMHHSRMPSNVVTTFSINILAWLLSSSGPALKHISTTSLYLLPTLLASSGTRTANTTRSLHFSAEYEAL